MAGITQQSSATAFPFLIPLRREWLSKKRENKMKDIIGISITYWRVHLR